MNSYSDESRKRIKSEEDFELEAAELEKNRNLLDVQLASFAKARAPKDTNAIDFGDDGPSAGAADEDEDEGGTGFDTEYGEEAEQEKKAVKEAVASAANDDEVNEADIKPTLARYNDLMWMCAQAKELRPTMYFWKELHKDGLVPNDATYESLDFLLSKIHQLENRCHLSNLPLYHRDDTAPPKKWIREVCKARSAARNNQAVEGHVAIVETWLKTNPEEVVANAFKTATAVARAIPHLSSAKARTIVISLNKKGLLKSIIKSRDSSSKSGTAAAAGGAGKTANVQKKKKKVSRSEGARIAAALVVAAKAEKQAAMSAAGKAGGGGGGGGSSSSGGGGSGDGDGNAGETEEEKKARKKKRKSKSRNNRP